MFEHVYDSRRIDFIKSREKKSHLTIEMLSTSSPAKGTWQVGYPNQINLCMVSNSIYNVPPWLPLVPFPARKDKSLQRLDDEKI